MSYVLRFLPEVEDDAVVAYHWYEGNVPSLGEEFLRTFYACATELIRNPLLSPPLHRQFRRRLLRRFPYALYFTIENHEVVVVGLFHCARDPKGVQSTLRDRQS